MFVRVLQRNRTTRPYRNIHKGRFIIGVGSRVYGGREVPLSAVCKLEPQEAGGEIQTESKDRRTRSTGARGQEKTDVPGQAEKGFALSLPFCSSEALNRLDEAHPHWWG